jgi:nucleoside-diphosphate-sugar epimerase
MHTLLVGGGALAAPLTAALAAYSPVRAFTADPFDTPALATALQGARAVVYLDLLPSSADPAALDRATRGTYTVLHAAHTAGVVHSVLVSSLALFAACPATWLIDERWRPRPRPAIPELCAWLGELCAREIARSTGLAVRCLRFGELVADHERPQTDCYTTHAAAAALIADALTTPTPGWSVLHAASGPRGRRWSAQAHTLPIGAALANDRDSAEQTIAPSGSAATHIPPRPIRRVALLGAGGPLAAVVARELAPDYELTLVDKFPLSAVVPRSPQEPTLTIGTVPGNWHVADVRDPDQLLRACEHADAIINCTVIRRDPEDAFLVNTLGAYHVMQAAVTHQIARVVHTGPFQLGQPGATGYDWDVQVVEDVPARPGGGWDLYFHSKLAGQEICRIFAAHYGMTVPTLLFSEFLWPQDARFPLFPLTISWDDAARAVRAALVVPTLPEPFELLHIGADVPHGVFPNAKAKRLLGWHPQDDLRGGWEAG